MFHQFFIFTPPRLSICARLERSSLLCSTEDMRWASRLFPVVLPGIWWGKKKKKKKKKQHNCAPPSPAYKLHGLSIYILCLYPPPLLYQIFTCTGVMGCGAAEATGLSFVCFGYQPSCVLSQQSWFGLFLFHKFSSFTNILYPPFYTPSPRPTWTQSVGAPAAVILHHARMIKPLRWGEKKSDKIPIFFSRIYRKSIYLLLLAISKRALVRSFSFSVGCSCLLFLVF